MADTKNFVVDPLNISFGKLIVLQEAKLSVQYGEHYGLIGKNGVGKTSLLNAIVNHQINVPADLDIICVKQEEPESASTVLETLVSTDVDLYNKNKRLTELEVLIETDLITDDLSDEYDNLCQLIGSDYIKAQIRARRILFGLGFDIDQQQKSVSEFSGGWRMRISLAKALFMIPTLLILDEPTNHLDLYANIWLCEYLKTYPKTIIVVSHDKYLINEVCTIIININNYKLNYYRGNYDNYERQLAMERAKIKKDYELFEKRIIAMRKSNKPKSDIEALIKKTNIIKPDKNYMVKIKFLQPSILKEVYIIMENISFGYANQEIILSNVNLVVNAKTRMAICGKNGVGKSTLMKLITNELVPISGQIIKATNLKIGYYNQHFEESLPANLTSVEYLTSLNTTIGAQQAHQYLSMFGLEPMYHKTLISQLSGGQKARVKFASFGVIKPHLLLLDEPTNHLDMETLDSLITALNNFDGAVIVVTHNFDMVTSLNSELWIVEDTKLRKHIGKYEQYVQDIYNEILD